MAIYSTARTRYFFLLSFGCRFFASVLVRLGTAGRERGTSMACFSNECKWLSVGIRRVILLSNEFEH